MSWFNYYGLIIIAVIMAPNIIYSVKHKEGFKNEFKNKFIEIAEQIGRYGCLAFMIFNIPYTYFNFWFGNALVVYLSVNGALCILYCVLWAVFWNKNHKAKALSLSVLPTVVFLFSGIVLLNVPLIAFSVIFGIFHIFISCKNAAK